MAGRILGMGDVLTLIEKAEQEFDVEQAKAMEEKLRKAAFDLEDFLDQLQKVKKMGSMTQLLGMLPGIPVSERSMPMTSMRLSSARSRRSSGR